jgi:membrane fusion protein, heavy metal efflux system
VNRVLFILVLTGLVDAAEAADAKRAANTVVLSETGVKNLRIETIEVEETEFEESIFSLGRIEAIPSKRSGVSSRIAGRILELNVGLGDAVEAGVEVALLESRQAAEQPITVTLKARTGGLVTRANVAQGEPLEPETTLMEITDLSEVYAIARVPEHQAGKMKPSTIAHIKVAALPDEPFDGELLRFGTEADRESGTLDAIFKLPNPNLTLRPGMRAEFSIVLSKREGVMSVPRSALQGDAATRSVYVKDFDLPNAFVKTPVEVGQMNDRFAEITNGLLPGDSVVTRGAYSLAFAGGGSISLKEALDAAHGHEHAADGGELPAGKATAPAGGGDAHQHHEEGKLSGLTILSLAGNALLLGLLVAASARRAHRTQSAVEPPEREARQATKTETP